METHITAKGNLMKRAFLTIMLLCLFVLGTHDAQAQEYVPGYYEQYGDETQLDARQYDPYNELDMIHRGQLYPQQDDPYQELDEMHYKSYLPQFNSYLLYPYPYPPCCVPGGY